MRHFSNCPICNSTDIQPALTAKDFTVSQKLFAIWHCNNCMARFTQDQPDNKEISSYYESADYISHSDTQKGLINKLYHLVRKITLQTKRRLIKRESGMYKGTLLDIGCGTGAFLQIMKEAGWTVTGIEPEVNARIKALELYGIQTLEPAKLFELEPASYHAITMWHVLEHVHDLHEYIQQMAKLLAPGGKIFIAVPNYTSSDAKTYASNWAAYDVPRHLYHFSPQSMKILLSGNNLAIQKYKPMWFDSFYISMLSEQYKNGRGNNLKACWNGLVSNFKAISDAGKCSAVVYVAGRE